MAEFGVSSVLMPTLYDLRHEPTVRRFQGEEFVARTFEDFCEALIAGLMLDGYDILPSDSTRGQQFGYLFLAPSSQSLNSEEFYFSVMVPLSVLRVRGSNWKGSRAELLDDLRREAVSRKQQALKVQSLTFWERLGDTVEEIVV